MNYQPLKFSVKSLQKIQSLSQKISEINYADSIGIDFHKTGFCPYTSSIFMIKDKNRYFSLNPSKNILYHLKKLKIYAILMSLTENLYKN